MAEGKKSSKRKREEMCTVSGKEIVDSIQKKMRMVDAAGKGESGTRKVELRLCKVKAPGATLATRSGTVQDLQEYLIKYHHFENKRKLPVKKRFCTSTGLHEPKKWGHLIRVKGHLLGYVVGYEPAVSKTHGFVSVFCFDRDAVAEIGAIGVRVSPVDGKECHMRTARFSWSEIPHAGMDLEQVCGLFPMKLLTPRLAEGRPHERAVEAPKPPT
ncbi:unnamed protein product [Prorocentrum cordatum]|uniref:Uncharacterized protein n=1 Tax=Prorocentrum cordatum TaxID=2364126 RepID=A0ABN9QHR9_9DINO|nr:unnamed protein product [Polarella glacialis]